MFDLDEMFDEWFKEQDYDEDHRIMIRETWEAGWRQGFSDGNNVNY